MDGDIGQPAGAAADPHVHTTYARGDPERVRKPSPFAVHCLRQQFLDPAVEAAFQRWQTEVVFYKVCSCVLFSTQASESEQESRSLRTSPSYVPDRPFNCQCSGPDPVDDRG